MSHKFNPQSRMSDLIEEDASLLSTVSRFGISFGFGNKTIAEACEANQIDTETFLAVVNFIVERNVLADIITQHLSVETVINYLKNGHSYFLAYKLPSIRKKLVEAIDASEFRQVLLLFFDEYVGEVRKHMSYEDDTVFPYVMRLLSGEKELAYKISVFEDHHTDVDSKLSELKNILIKYYPSKVNDYQLNEILFDLMQCKLDLEIHNMVEDYFFVPVIEVIEQQVIK